MTAVQSFISAAIASFRRCSSIRAAWRRSRASASSASPFRRARPAGARLRARRGDHQARGRPLTAFCACELRSPAPFTDDGFRAFNELYVETLASGASTTATDATPSRAATSVPELAPPAEPCFHAFSLHGAGADERAPPSSWPAAARRGKAARSTASAPCATARPAPMRCAKRPVYVLGEMERRLRLLGSVLERYDAPARSTPCTISIHSLPTRSSAAGRRDRADLASTAGPRCTASSTRWTAGPSRSSISSNDAGSG